MKKTLILFSFLLLLVNITIGQTWQWAKQGLGGIAGNIYGGLVATDKHGNVYTTGYYSSNIVFGSITLTDDDDNVYLVKYNSAGNVVWAIQPGFAVTGRSYSTSVTTDTAGNVFISGFFYDTINFGTYRLTSNTLYGEEYYVAKFDSNGNALWAKQSESTYDNAVDEVIFVTTDNSGDAYIAGSYYDTISFGPQKLTTQSNPSKPYNSGSDVFLVKYDPNGNILWATQSDVINSNDTVWYFFNYPTGISTDNLNNVYLTGSFNDSLTFGTNLLSASPIPYSNAGSIFLVKYNGSGNALWARQSKTNGAGYSSNAGSEAVTTDKFGNAYITGYFFDTLSFAGSPLISPVTEMFLAKYSGAGNFMWAEQAYSSDSSSCSGNALSSDVHGGICITGNGITYFDNNVTNSINFGSLSLSYYVNYGNVQEGKFIMKLDTSGKALCGSIVSSSLNSTSFGVASDSSGKYIYVGGTTDDSISFSGNNIISNSGEATPYVARWTFCCGTLALKGSAGICAGGNDTLTAIGNVQGGYVWSIGETTQSIVVSPLSSETYYLSSLSNSCNIKDSIRLSVHTKPVDTVCCGATVLAGTSTQLGVSPVVAGYIYTWYPAEGLSCTNCPDPQATPIYPTTYVVAVSDSGCITEDSVYVNVDGRCGELFIPKAFSPNGDGENDVLYVRAQCIETLDFEVFDRWGNKVFESTSLSMGWDGRYNGQPMNTGTYTYVATATTTYGAHVEAHGNVTLIR